MTHLFSVDLWTIPDQMPVFQVPVLPEKNQSNPPSQLHPFLRIRPICMSTDHCYLLNIPLQYPAEQGKHHLPKGEMSLHERGMFLCPKRYNGSDNDLSHPVPIYMTAHISAHPHLSLIAKRANAVMLFCYACMSSFFASVLRLSRVQYVRIS